MDTPVEIPIDEILSLAARIAARVHPRWCGQSNYGTHHIEWVVRVEDAGRKHWVQVGVASKEYLEFILDQGEQQRWESIAALVDKMDRFIADNITGIPPV